MHIRTQLLALTLAGCLAVGSTAHAQSRRSNTGSGTVIWTVAGAGGGFGVGLWVGLTKYDDAINSDRKVWTSAIVGAAIGAVGAYLIGRSRADRPRSNPSANIHSVLRPISFEILSGDRCRREPSQSQGMSHKFLFQYLPCESSRTIHPGHTLFNAPVRATKLGTK